MRRTDRLFDLIQILRDGRLHRASEMAERLQVSVRTIWRDVATLAASGLPVEGERGVGYILRAPITLPPMILNALELEALREGLRLAAASPEPTLARAARALAKKIASVTPAPIRDDPGDLFAFPGQLGTGQSGTGQSGTGQSGTGQSGTSQSGTGPSDNRAPAHLPALRRAIKAQERVTITYIDPRGLESHRDIRPLLLEKNARVSALAAWCEARGDFRSFRVDRIMSVTPTGERFPIEAERSLAAYRARVEAEKTAE